jgi:hypothetical protein
MNNTIIKGGHIMSKLIVDGKEFENEAYRVQTLTEAGSSIALSDNELESTMGGVTCPGQILAFRWECAYPGCDVKGAWQTNVVEADQDPSWPRHTLSNPGHTKMLGTLISGSTT